MRRHEERCTLNPNRYCGMCDMMEEWEQQPIKRLIEIVKKYVKITKEIAFGYEWTDYHLEKDKELMKELGEATNYCPACTLAAIRQADVPVPVTSFDFKEACSSFWSDFNKEHQSLGYY